MNADFRIAIEWDIATWGRALVFWEEILEDKKINLGQGLEIGSRNGGLSWYFAKKHHCQMCCTDYGLPSEEARHLHNKSGLAHLLRYQQADASQLPFSDATFDFVVFKSVLGAVGRHDQPEKQQRAIAEIHRVLRAGGVLFFAENLRGSAVHQMARQFFVPWGKSWRYVDINELGDWLSVFQEKEICTTGFFAAFAPRPECLKNIFAQLDRLLFFFPKKWKYVAYGYAQKGR